MPIMHEQKSRLTVLLLVVFMAATSSTMAANYVSYTGEFFFAYPEDWVQMDYLTVDAFLIINISAGIGKCHGLSTQIQNFLAGVLGDITASGNQTNPVLKRFIPCRKHLRSKIYRTVTGRFRTNQRTAPV